jgi:hypothetical protein
MYGAANGYLTAEISAIGDWYNTGGKFMWIGYDSDYGGAVYISDNMTAILEAAGSHVYGEPTSVEDPVSNCASPYRAVANGTSSDPYVASIVKDVSKVMMHGPTLVYGSNSATPAADVSPVALETVTIEDVYPLLYYGGNATIVDADINYPLAHTDGQKGAFVAATIELNAGADGSGALIVSGASPYGDYRPMNTDVYYGVVMTGYRLVYQAIHYGVMHATNTQNHETIVFDYTHGQYSGTVKYLDLRLRTELFLLGYTTIWALGGINSTILADADGFIAGSIYGAANGYLTAEISAIGDWYNTGGKFMWIGYDSDYGGYVYISDNMTAILEAAGSHVYGEPTSVEDPVSNCASPYRAVANGTSSDPYVASIVKDVSHVMMHGPTLVYGSNNATPAADRNPVPLETVTIGNVYPLLYYGGNATIVDADVNYPLAHTDGQKGAFVAATIEVNVGADDSGVLVVSGASPYGDYRPMNTDVYYGVVMDGDNLVRQAIHFGMRTAEVVETTTTTPPTTSTTTTTTSTPGGLDPVLLAAVGIGAVVVIVIIIAVARRK